ncbi:hypothetical protein [Allokutzneria oryzae]|uniref:Uncharacterized protein n=1 Tax=Allokutzneria oryzae TaxID=1378989 RepID=A0ABV6A964_9PSEU
MTHDPDVLATFTITTGAAVANLHRQAITVPAATSGPGGNSAVTP